MPGWCQTLQSNCLWGSSASWNWMAPTNFLCKPFNIIQLIQVFHQDFGVIQHHLLTQTFMCNVGYSYHKPSIYQFLMVFTTHVWYLWWLGGWFISAIPTWRLDISKSKVLRTRWSSMRWRSRHSLMARGRPVPGGFKLCFFLRDRWLSQCLGNRY